MEDVDTDEPYVGRPRSAFVLRGAGLRPSAHADRPPNGRVRVFRGRFSLIGNLIAGAAAEVLFVVLLVSVIGEPPAGGFDPGLVVIAAAGVLFGIVLLVLSVRSATLILRRDELVSRTMFHNRHIPRSDIVNVRIEQGGLFRGGGVQKGWIPVLELANGSSIWLPEMRAIVQSSLDSPDYYDKYTQRMMAALREWAGTVA